MNTGLATKEISKVKSVIRNNDNEYNFIYDDETAYIHNTKILEKLVNNTKEKDTLFLENPNNNNTIYIDKIKITKNINIKGNNIIIKRAPLVAKNKRLSELKSYRLINLAGTKATDVSFYDLTLDGSIQELYERYNVAFEKYEIEHSALLFVGKKNNPNQDQVNVIIENCHFINSGGDGIHLYRNVNAFIYNSSATDCFRGGVTLTGGNSKLFVDGFKTYDISIPTGIDIEIDNADYSNSKKVEVSLKNLVLDSQLDIGVHDKSIIYGENIKLLAPPLSLSIVNSKASFKNCDFVNGDANYKKSRIRAFGDLTFDNCVFTAIKGNSSVRSASPIVVDGGFTNQTVLFKNSKFRVDSAHYSRGSTYIGVPLGVSNNKDRNLKIFKDCLFEENLNVGIQTFQGNCEDEKASISRGGDIEIDNCTFNSKTPIRIRGFDSHPFNLNMKNSKFNSDIFLYLKPLGTVVKDTLKLSNTILDQAYNKILIAGGKSSFNNLTIIGNRIISGETIPNTINANCLKGDKFICKNKIWECIEPGYYYLGNKQKLDDCDPIEDINQFKLTKSKWILTNLTPDEIKY